MKIKEKDKQRRLKNIQNKKLILMHLLKKSFCFQRENYLRSVAVKKLKNGRACHDLRYYVDSFKKESNFSELKDPIIFLNGAAEDK